MAVTIWVEMTADALEDILSVDAHDGSKPSRAGVLRNLIFSLSQPSHTLRIHAIKMLKHFTSINRMVLDCGMTDSLLLTHDPASLFTGIINESVKSIADMAVYDDEGVQDDGLELLTALAKANGKGKLYVSFRVAHPSSACRHCQCGHLHTICTGSKCAIRP